MTATSGAMLFRAKYSLFIVRLLLHTTDTPFGQSSDDKTGGTYNNHRAFFLSVTSNKDSSPVPMARFRKLV
jgi:hypothetical protein